MLRKWQRAGGDERKRFWGGDVLRGRRRGTLTSSKEYRKPLAKKKTSIGGGKNQGDNSWGLDLTLKKKKSSNWVGPDGKETRRHE